MKTVLSLLMYLALGLAPSWAASPAPVPPAQEAQAEKQAADYSYDTLPKSAQNESAQSEKWASEKIIQDRKEERSFKYNALIALSCTMALLYLVAATMLYRLHERINGVHIVHLTSLALIVYGALTLALVPTTNEGLTAPIGILGALAGYLFGHAGARSPSPQTGDRA